MSRRKQENNCIKEMAERTSQSERNIYRKLRRTKVWDHNNNWIDLHKEGLQASVADIVSIGAIDTHMLKASDIYLDIIKSINKNTNNLIETSRIFKHLHKEFKSKYEKRLQYEKPIQFANSFKEVVDMYLNGSIEPNTYWIEEKKQYDTYKLIINTKDINVLNYIKNILKNLD